MVIRLTLIPTKMVLAIDSKRVVYIKTVIKKSSSVPHADIIEEKNSYRGEKATSSDMKVTAPPQTNRTNEAVVASDVVTFIAWGNMNIKHCFSK